MFEKKKIKISMTIYVMGKVLLHTWLCDSIKKAIYVQGSCASGSSRNFFQGGHEKT